ncbi:MAG: PP2C family protein-serine/threonine phosphatase [Planctomycetota bacterium]|jgi:serine phosphatase RsbU (regulator of sigma subunit)
MSRTDVLVVDDEPGILRAVTRVLTGTTDLDVETTEDPREAIAILREGPPKVLLTDYQMPELSGLDVLREARRSAPDTIRVLLTGHADRAAIIDAINVGRIFRYVAKPWSNENLTAVIREALQAHQAQRDRQSLHQTLEMASGVQRTLLPAGTATGETAVVLTPYEYASGDYVDALDLPAGRAALLMGDVCGHGVGAALFVTAARALLRSGLSEGGDLAEVVERTNRCLCRDMQDGRFLTLFAAVHDPALATLEYINAGHAAPLVLAQGEVLDLPTTGLPLGLVEATCYARRPAVPFRPGQMMLAYTDGVTEARNAEGEFFGHQRLTDLLRGREAASPADLLTRIQETVQSFAGGRPVKDDIALLAFRPHARKGASVSAR